MMIGMAWILLASVFLGTFALPAKYIKNWSWEHTWGTFFFMGMLVVPVGFSFLALKGLSATYAQVSGGVILGVVALGQLVHQRLRQLRLAKRGDPLDLRQVGDRHDSRHNRHLNADLPAALLEQEKIGIVIEKLRDHAVGARFDLPFEVLQIRLRAGCLLMRFRIPGHRDPELRELAADQSHQFHRVPQPPLDGHKLRGTPRRIASQGHDVVDPQPLRPREVVPQLVHR